MNPIDKIKDVRNLPLLGLLITIFVSFLLLITINFYTIRTMSSVRAYINGESNYSKGEKDATQSLISYIYTNDSKDWDDFVRNIGIPKGDSIARVTLLNDGSIEVIRNGFLQGNNHPEDVSNMIWLFKTFKNVSLMAGPIIIWANGDSLIYQKWVIAHQVKSAIEIGDIENKKQPFLIALRENSDALTQQETAFSESLGAVARQIREYLFYANTIIIFLILGTVSIYALTVLRRLKARNTELTHINNELDRIAYGVSHDLRAPINSMLGLLNLAKEEKNTEKVEVYLSMMQTTLGAQERFIKEMIATTKENRRAVKKEIVDLDNLINQVINVHKHMTGANDIEFSMSVGVHRVFTDGHRLETILNNLVSNAIKYHDKSKSDKFVKINTYSDNDKIHIDVTDNGIGIEDKDRMRIFEMYFMSKNQEKSSGLGLYIVKEAITKLDGEIRVKSAKGEGSTFTVILNK